MAVRLSLSVCFAFTFCAAVNGDFKLDLRRQMLSFKDPVVKYSKDMSSLLMKDEKGRPFLAVLKGENNFNLGLGSSLEEAVTFYLYTRDYNKAVQVFTNDVVDLQNTTFNYQNPTIVLIHGFINTMHSASVQLIREAYLSTGDFNVVAVDWNDLAKGPWYNHAASQTHGVGLKVAEFIDYLIESNVSIESVHVIGHSLGAHVAGVAAKNIRAGKIARVTGDCSHGRSYQYYAESIYDAFVAGRCEDIAAMKEKKCDNGMGLMGHHSTGTPSGIYYLATNKQYPFNKH